MKQRVSRRNGRTASARARSIRDAAILAVSLIVFLGGAGGLAWALHADPAQDGNTSPPSRPTAQSEQSDPYAGIIISAPGDDTLVGEDATSKTGDALDEPSLAPDEADGHADEISRAPSIPFPADSANATTSPEPQTGYVVHHTAYREQPVYRIAHHQVSTAREIIVAGKTHVEWTRCPVCNERHARAYNERVVDHVSPVFCAACGGRHEADYDETVYG